MRLFSHCKVCAFVAPLEPLDSLSKQFYGERFAP